VVLRAIPEFREGERVRCIEQVNGLRYRGLYKVTAVRSTDAFYWGRVIEVREVDTGLVPTDGKYGYFAWRFEREPML
jgi:hypothetical protein